MGRYNFGRDFGIDVSFKRDWPPVLSLSCFSIRVITACLWDGDISFFIKASLKELIKVLLINGQKVL